jgi:hypothetical protein
MVQARSRQAKLLMFIQLAAMAYLSRSSLGSNTTGHAWPKTRQPLSRARARNPVFLKKIFLLLWQKRE